MKMFNVVFGTLVIFFVSLIHFSLESVCFLYS